MSLYDEKKQLYLDYCKELAVYYDDPSSAMTEEEAESAFEEYITSEDCSWRNIFAEDGNLAGFLIIGKHGRFCHPDAMRSISEAYIKPEYRGKGLMKAEAGGYLSRHPGVFALLVLKKNRAAKGFWKHLFKIQNFSPIYLDDSYVEPDIQNDAELLGYAFNH